MSEICEIANRVQKWGCILHKSEVVADTEFSMRVIFKTH